MAHSRGPGGGHIVPPTKEEIFTNIYEQIKGRESVNVYTGNEMWKAIEETVRINNWSIVLNTDDKSIQKQLIGL